MNLLKCSWKTEYLHLPTTILLFVWFGNIENIRQVHLLYINPWYENTMTAQKVDIYLLGSYISPICVVIVCTRNWEVFSWNSIEQWFNLEELKDQLKVRDFNLEFNYRWSFMKIEIEMRKSINNVNNWITLIDYSIIN